MSDPATCESSTTLIDAWLRREDLLDRFSAYNPAVREFVHVLGREDVARELTLADVASMVDSPACALVALANGAAVAPRPSRPMRWEQPAQDPEAAEAGGPDVEHLDTRPLFESGYEPLPAILGLVARTRGRAVVVIDAPFHPAPLRRLLARRGYASRAEEVAADHWRITFTPGPRATSPGPALPIAAVFCTGAAPTGSILTEVAHRLGERGVRLAGVVKGEPWHPGDEACNMTLAVLPEGTRIDITQNLGTAAESCRLDHHALEESVGLVDRGLDETTELLVLNKFGRRESEGAGFRQTIARALEMGVPVLVGVGRTERPALESFVGGEFTLLPEDVEAILAWVEETVLAAGYRASG